ncbi:MAG: transcription antitermination factor NusB [Verrucomicrobiaceae bacterium]|nr:transcription antitermination factor NusB [Verrucomicrobiaceae bacterium]
MDSSNSRAKTARKKAPSPRRDGREAALQFLYGNDIQGILDGSPEAIAAFWKLRDAKPAVREFATELIAGVMEHLSQIDSAIRNQLENFSFQRLTAVDRNILRLGAFEILHANYIPPQAAINEAIEIAKRFGSDDSARFVNGILDKILKR